MGVFQTRPQIHTHIHVHTHQTPGLCRRAHRHTHALTHSWAQTHTRPSSSFPHPSHKENCT